MRKINLKIFFDEKVSEIIIFEKKSLQNGLYVRNRKGELIRFRPSYFIQYADQRAK